MWGTSRQIKSARTTVALYDWDVIHESSEIIYDRKKSLALNFVFKSSQKSFWTSFFFY